MEEREIAELELNISPESEDRGENDTVEILEEENEPSEERQDADGASVELTPMRNQEGRGRVRVRVYGSPLSTSDVDDMGRPRSVLETPNRIERRFPGEQEEEDLVPMQRGRRRERARI